MKIIISILLLCCTTLLSAQVQPKTTSVDIRPTLKSDIYTISVGISSPDTGCTQYADWWEIVTPDGTLLYRRILGHSHVTEQPFVRSGNTVTLDKDQEVYIRMHMNNTGYSDLGHYGSIATGFKAVALPTDFALGLAKEKPLPTGCGF